MAKQGNENWGWPFFFYSYRHCLCALTSQLELNFDRVDIKASTNENSTRELIGFTEVHADVTAQSYEQSLDDEAYTKCFFYINEF